MYIKMVTDTILLWLATMDYYLFLLFVWAIHVSLLSLVNKKATINTVLAFNRQNYLERLFFPFLWIWELASLTLVQSWRVEPATSGAVDERYTM